ncbi:hypothetical protein GE061_008749 [Apolygus lucorum]|uniref:Peptidase S1 domain-containing protein n=1 Tax=Apolygus lucorum TaxID=248454 RepID=A0A8S9WLU7_APOLU|nr:hypothetical protein GE061_008749 [Apolygus lucorum]
MKQVGGAAAPLVFLALASFCVLRRAEAPNPTTPDEFTYVGILLYNGEPECLGTLVSVHRLLTACRCLVKDRNGPISSPQNLDDVHMFFVFAGFANRTDPKRPQGQYRGAESIFVHPKCVRNNASMMYDYGLVHTVAPFIMAKNAVSVRDLTSEKSAITGTIDDAGAKECFALDAAIVFNDKGRVKLFELVKVDVTRQDKESCSKSITEKKLEFDGNAQVCAKRATDPPVECGKKDFAGLLFCKSGTVPIGMLTGRDKIYCGAALPEVYSRLDVGVEWYNGVPTPSTPKPTLPTKPLHTTKNRTVTARTDNTLLAFSSRFYYAEGATGTPVNPEDFAYYASVIIDDALVCGGSLYAPDRLLTGCHCLVQEPTKPIAPPHHLQDAAKIVVYAGFDNKSDPLVPSKEKRGATKTHVHPKCRSDDKTFVYDFGMIELASPFKLKKGFIEARNLVAEKGTITQTIDDPETHECIGLDFELVAKEAGKINFGGLSKLYMGVFDEQFCKKALGEHKKDFDAALQICGKRKRDPEVKCGNVDTAVPLFCREGAVMIGFLTGRHGVYCGAEVPEVYSRLDVGLSWIEEMNHPTDSPGPVTSPTDSSGTETGTGSSAPKTSPTSRTVTDGDDTIIPTTPGPSPAGSSPAICSSIITIRAIGMYLIQYILT